MSAKKDLIMREKFVEIFYDTQDKVVIAKWVGFLKPEDVKTGCEAINDQIRTNKLTKHISDHTKLKVLSKEVQEYLTQEWFINVEKMGLEKIAVLVSEDVFAQATVNNVNMKGAVGKLQIHTFNALSQCEHWLMKA